MVCTQVHQNNYAQQLPIPECHTYIHATPILCTKRATHLLNLVEIHSEGGARAENRFLWFVGEKKKKDEYFSRKEKRD